jgi:hypothetical protein
MGGIRLHTDHNYKIISPTGGTPGKPKNITFAKLEGPEVME